MFVTYPSVRRGHNGETLCHLALRFVGRPPRYPFQPFKTILWASSCYMH